MVELSGGEGAGKLLLDLDLALGAPSLLISQFVA